MLNKINAFSGRVVSGGRIETLRLSRYGKSETYEEDIGCKQVAPSCLNCPLAACKHDDNKGYRLWLKGETNLKSEVEQALISGEDPKVIAARFGKNVRTILRIKTNIKDQVPKTYRRRNT